MEENKILVHYKTSAAFQADLDAGNIDETAVHFIDDLGLIWNRGTFYGKTSLTNIPLVNHTETTYAIEPNIFHVWGVITTLDITLATPENTNIYNEYLFQFSTGDTLPTLSLPSDIKWRDSVAPILMENKTYQISIVDNLAIYTEF